jgi:hypothetical protein
VNIVFLTTGCANSTVCVKMLAAMGWHVGAINDDKYMENRGVYDVNRRTTTDDTFDRDKAAAAIAALPTPWVVKDPRFCRTMRLWRPVFAPYTPTLLWVTKDLEYVKSSMMRRFQMKPEWADKRFQWATTIFQSWPWSRVQIDVSQIAEAVKLFDVTRSFAHAGATELGTTAAAN